MARKFNLQPWRAELRAKQKKDFMTATAVVFLVAAGLCGGYWYFKNQYLESQNRAISLLDNNIAELKKTEAEVNKMKALNEEVLKQILVIQGLQNQRSLSVEILDYLAINTPKSVFLDSISYKQGQITITGTAENDVGVSSFIRVLNDFKHFSIVRLVDMQKAKTGNRYSVTDETGVRVFTLVITVEPKFGIEADIAAK